MKKYIQLIAGRGPVDENGSPRHLSADWDFCRMQHTTVAVAEQGNGSQSTAYEIAAAEGFRDSRLPCGQMEQAYRVSARQSDKIIFGTAISCPSRNLSARLSIKKK